MTSEVVPLAPPTYAVGITIPEQLYTDLVACVQEYRDECEGLGMPQTVAAIERLLARATAV